MNINGIKINPLYILITIAALLLVFFINAIIEFAKGQTKTDNEKKRLKELKKQQKAKPKAKNKKEEYRNLVDKITAPITDTVLKSYSKGDNYKLERMLKIAELDTVFTAASWRAFQLLLALLGLVLFLLLFSKSLWGAIGIGLAFIIAPAWLLKNTYNNINADILFHFPDVIRTAAGYLSSGLLLPRAMEETSKTSSKRWKVLLEGFAERCKTHSPVESLEWLKEQVDVPQARQFFVTILLSMENGIDAESSFIEQADFIDDLLDDARQRELESREMTGTLLQPVVIVLILAAYAAPIIYQIASSGIFGALD